MIELYTPGDDVAGADFGDLFSRARSLLARGGEARRSEAIRAMFAALRYTHVRDDDYRRALELLAGAYADAGRPREALTVAWYLDDRARIDALRARVPDVDRARSLLLASRRGSRDPARDAREAGSLLETAGRPVRAAIAFEQAEDWDRARALWSRLAGNLAGGDRPYEAALAHFDLARASKRVGDARAARSAATAAVHFAEEAADRFESEGLRERAFDCYEVILAIGRETGTFEDVLAGYVNVLRILREDFLRHYALQKYAEAIEVARKEGELAAAATLARELSEYARAGGNPTVANRAALDEAELWRGVAKSSSARGAKDAAEHALLATVLALADVGQMRTIGEVYGELAKVAADEAKRAYYERARKRYDEARDERLELPAPATAKADIAFPDVWHVDLLEWEDAGSAAEACADVLLDDRSYAEVTRRRALVARLVALGAEADGGKPEALAVVAQFLATLELYAALSPLEALSRSPIARVRVQAVRALSRFLFKRTFVAVRERLSDGDPEVAKAAAETIERLVFTQAIDPLFRLYRDGPTRAGRLAALRALANIERIEAASIVVGALAHGSREDRECAAEAVRAATPAAFRHFVQAAKTAVQDLDPTARSMLRAVLDERPLG